MLNRIISLFKKITLNDPMLGLVEVKKDHWKGDIDVPEIGYPVNYSLYFYKEPLEEQKQLVTYFKKNVDKILDECTKIINEEADLGDIKLNKSNILQNFKLNEVVITKSQLGDNISWEIAYEPLSFDGKGHVFNVVYMNHKPEGLAIDG